MFRSSFWQDITSIETKTARIKAVETLETLVEARLLRNISKHKVPVSKVSVDLIYDRLDFVVPVSWAVLEFGLSSQDEDEVQAEIESPENTAKFDRKVFDFMSPYANAEKDFSGWSCHVSGQELRFNFGLIP